jgi:hypothetical protein
MGLREPYAKYGSGHGKRQAGNAQGAGASGSQG